MPTPVASNNSSVYDPSLDHSPIDGCDPNLSSCAAYPPVEIEPVHINGDAGKQALLAQLEASRCRSDGNEAALALVGLAVAVSQASPPAAALASLLLAKESSEYAQCTEAAAQWTHATIECESREGTPLRGARDGELVCLVVKP